MDVNEYKDIYLAEAREYLQSLNDSLLKLESEPDNGELVQEMFRAAHSLKGMSATMGYDHVTKLTHEMENILHLLREGSLALSSPLADVLFSSFDTLENLLAHIENPQLPEVATQSVIDRLNEQMNPSEAEELEVCATAEEVLESPMLNQDHPLVLEEFEKEIIKEAKEQGNNLCFITVKISEGSLLKSVRAYMVIKALEELGVIIKAQPPVSDLEEDNFEHTFTILFQSSMEDDAIERCLYNISEIESITLQEYLASEEVNQSQIHKKDEAPQKNSQEQPTGNKAVNATNAASLAVQEKTVRVDTSKLDKLINLVGELVINRTRIVELGKTEASRGIMDASEQLDRITSELQSAIMKLRMVPIKQVFDRFPRMVRDLSKEKGKNVCLEMIGEDTELDRSIVNQIGDPLIHLLRNSMDHGIESTEERVKAGKTSEGNITLTARHEGSYIAIEVKDDGAGLDAEKILRTAVKKKMMTKEEADALKAEEAYNLIFANGFSTAKKVTDISGRGVGMDAVKRIVEGLNGLIEVYSVLGKGTSIIIRLPLTLAIIRALLVRTGDEIYAIPVENIRENLHVTEEDIKNVNKQKVISLRNEVIPLVSLEGCLKEQEDYHWTGEVPTVIVVSGEKKSGLMVDELLGQQEIVIKSLGSMMGKLKGIAGATVLGNGKVALILNIATLL